MEYWVYKEEVVIRNSFILDPYYWYSDVNVARMGNGPSKTVVEADLLTPN